MKECKSKSTQVFQVRLWSHEHFKVLDEKKGKTRMPNVWDGLVIDEKTKKKIHFHNVGDMLKALEKMYHENEKVKQ